MKRFTLSFALLFVCSCGNSGPKTQAPADKHSSRPTSSSKLVTPRWVETYRDVAERISKAALQNDKGWQKLSFLTDNIGHRLSGSPSLEKAIKWARAEMETENLANVRVQKVMVPNWKRGKESASLIAPFFRPLRITTLGNSVGTKGTLKAPVVAVNSFEELEKIGPKIKGSIVLFTHAMPAYTEEHGSGYGDASKFRVGGPSAAGKFGAKAVLVRSLTAHSLQTPHTGTLFYPEGAPKVPAAAVTIEDSDFIERLLKSGKDVRVSLNLGAKMRPDAESGNVIGELIGSEAPEEIVLLGAHLDSWDLGQGAHDDGTGCIIMFEALALLNRLGLRPKRTIRVVLFTNEENGGRGAKKYAEELGDQVENHVMAIESDSGGFAPRGFSVQGTQAAINDTKAITSLLGELGIKNIEEGFSGADIYKLGEKGVPALGLRVDGSKYFDYHHTSADTLDKVNPRDLKKNIAAVAILAYVVADMPRRFGKPK